MRVEMEPNEEEKKQQEEANEAFRQARTKKTRKEQRAIFRQLSLGEKFWYIWDYYKIPIFVGIFVLIFAGLMIQALVQGSKEVVLEGVLLNCPTRNYETKFLDEYYLDARGYDKKDYNINVSQGLYIGDNVAHDSQVTSLTQMSAMMQLGELDYIISDSIGLEFYSEANMLTDLSKMLPEDIYEKYDSEGKIIWKDVCTEEDELGNRINPISTPVGIDIMGGKCDETLQFVNEDMCVCFPGNIEWSEELELFVEYLQTGETKKIELPSK